MTQSQRLPMAASTRALRTGGSGEVSPVIRCPRRRLAGIASDEDDTLIAGGNTVIAKIASITIKGTVAGTALGTDHFGLVAQEIGKLTVGDNSVSLTPGPGNDTTPIVLGGTVDVKAREVS